MGTTGRSPISGECRRTILYDNTRIAVAQITGDSERKPTEAFSGLQSHYLFAADGAEVVARTLGVEAGDLKWQQVSRPP